MNEKFFSMKKSKTIIYATSFRLIEILKKVIVLKADQWLPVAEQRRKDCSRYDNKSWGDGNILNTDFIGALQVYISIKIQFTYILNGCNACEL
jgi:hypothetical protein